MGRFAMAALAAFIGSASFASATEVSFKDAPVAPLAPIWTGFYVGGHAGGMWTGDEHAHAEKKKCFWWWCGRWKDAKHVEFEKDDDDVAFIGGLHVGYNWQQDWSVFGIEGDLSFADDLEYLATLRARLGYARGNLLLYATAGVAFAGFDDSFSFSTRRNTYSFDDDDDRKVGMVVGGGAEYKLKPNWSVGLEGLYYRFGDDTNTYYAWEGLKKYKVTEEEDNDFWVLRARMSYHLESEADVAPLK